MAISEARRRAGAEHRLFVWAAVLFPVIVLAGFARTYYLKGFFHTPALPSALVHLHGALMTAWVVLFITQVWLVSSDRVRTHQRLGLFGAGLAAVMVLVGVRVAIDQAARGITGPPGVPPLVFLVVPLMDMVVFVILLGAALWYRRRRPENHKRLMALTALNFLPPAVSRIPLAFIQSGGLPAVFGIADGLVLVAVAYDTWRNRRLNPAFALGALLILLSLPLRLAIGGSAWWMRFATWAVAQV